MADLSLKMAAFTQLSKLAEPFGLGKTSFFTLVVARMLQLTKGLTPK
ncbi:hypothetical protein [Peribacillus simplex]|nr:hypothetical protein [Peribacillus simplex]WHY57640.1 hypothetical protein QNH43_04955 [Peribacillus simplex]